MDHQDKNIVPDDVQSSKSAASVQMKESFLRALEIKIGDDKFREQMFKFLEKLFLDFCWGAFVSNSIIVLANVVLMPFGKQFEPVDRLIRASIIAVVMFICLKKKYDNIYTLNMFIYILYMTVETIIFDTCLKVSPFSQLMAMAVVIQYQNLLHKFSLFDRRQKISITIMTCIYQASRFHYYKTSIGQQGLCPDDVPTCLAFIVVQFSTLEVDDNFTSYVLDRFQKAAELEKQWYKSLQNMPNGIMLYNLNEKTVTFENEMMRNIFKEPEQENIVPKVYSSWLYKKLIRQEQTDEEKKQNKQKKLTSVKNEPKSFLQVIQDQIIMNKKRAQTNSKDIEGSSFKILDNKKKIDINSTIFKGISSSFALVTVSDVTKVKLFEKHKQGDRFKNMYFQSMAHDLRTPLVTIISANENLSLQYPDDPILDNIMKLSNSSCQYLISIIEQITELSKIQLKTFSLDQKYFNFRESLFAVIETMSIQSEFKDLEFCVNIDKNVPKKFVSDSKRINQVLFSLLGNAIKYTNVGHITVNIEKIIREDHQEEEQVVYQDETYDVQTIQFSVEDSGKGMSQEEQQNLFQLFGKVKASKNYQSTGVGLGLTFCKQVIEHLNGQIRCQSALNNGTKITYFIKVGVSPNDKGLTVNDHRKFLDSIQALGKIDKHMMGQPSNIEDEVNESSFHESVRQETQDNHLPLMMDNEYSVDSCTKGLGFNSEKLTADQVNKLKSGLVHRNQPANNQQTLHFQKQVPLLQKTLPPVESNKLKYQ